jgi:hypothetical protein
MWSTAVKPSKRVTRSRASMIVAIICYPPNPWPGRPRVSSNWFRSDRGRGTCLPRGCNYIPGPESGDRSVLRLPRLQRGLPGSIPRRLFDFVHETRNCLRLVEFQDDALDGVGGRAHPTRTTYAILIRIVSSNCRQELERRRRITRSKACRMPTDGSRQGMTVGPELVRRGHVASL